MSRTPTTLIRSVAVIDGERLRRTHDPRPVLPLPAHAGATDPRPARGRGLRLAWIG